MIDSGLLVSLGATLGSVWVLARLMPPRTMAARDIIDSSLTGILTGIATARVAAMAFDDPAGLRRLGDVLLLRGGLDFWPGVLAGALTLTVIWHRSGVAVVPRLADGAPYALCAYAAYEATCLARDGCFGPRSPVGLRPGGLGSPQFPIGLAVAIAVIGLAAGVRRLAAQSGAPAVMLAVGGLAATRFVAAFWLPRVSLGPTRQQVESLVVLAVAAVAGAVMMVAPPGIGIRTSQGDG